MKVLLPTAIARYRDLFTAPLWQMAWWLCAWFFFWVLPPRSLPPKVQIMNQRCNTQLVATSSAYADVCSRCQILKTASPRRQGSGSGRAARHRTCRDYESGLFFKIRNLLLLVQVLRLDHRMGSSEPFARRCYGGATASCRDCFCWPLLPAKKAHGKLDTRKKKSRQGRGKPARRKATNNVCNRHYYNYSYSNVGCSFHRCVSHYPSCDCRCSYCAWDY